MAIIDLVIQVAIPICPMIGISTAVEVLTKVHGTWSDPPTTELDQHE